jgi:hypothetical protein
MTDKESDTGKFYTNYSFEYPKENVVVSTSSFQEVPSNKKPLINLTMNGTLRPSEEKVHEIKMIFKGNVPQKDFLAQSYGTFVLCKNVYNARKIIKTAWDGETNTLTVIIDLTRQKVRPRRPAQFSFSVQIDDDCDGCFVTNWGNCCNEGAPYIKCNNTSWFIDTVIEGDCSVTLNLRTVAYQSRECQVKDVGKCICYNNCGDVAGQVCGGCS